MDPELPDDWPPIKNRIPDEGAQLRLVELIDSLIDNCNAQIQSLKKLKDSLLLGWSCAGNKELYRRVCDDARYDKREGRLYTVGATRIRNHLKKLRDHVNSVSN